MPNYTAIYFLLLILIKLSITDGELNKKQQRNKASFVDFITKYDPKTVRERLNKEQKLTGNLSDAEYIDAMFDGMDATDDLLKIKVQNGDARIALHDSGRRNGWVPPRGIGIYYKDVFNLRPRLFELMKQAIYQARNKLVIMQNYRAKYRNSSLYKMGYLMSKTDNACKTFSKFSYRAYKLCQLSRQLGGKARVYLYDVLACEERLINLWFTVDLLVDVLNKNDHICKTIIEEHENKRLKLWKFIE